jgi:hypothetical protein
VRVQTNEALVARRVKLGRIAWLVGMGILFGGLGASWMIERRPELTTLLLIISYVALIGGLAVTSIGIYTSDRWAREPRADQSLSRALKGLNNKYKLYNYLLPAEHVLLSPLGVTVFRVKRQDGRIEYQDGRWRHRQGLLGLFLSLSRERLGDPAQELAVEMERMRSLVQERLPDAEVPVQGVVVFTSPRADLHIVNPPLPAVPVKKLKAHLRSLSKRHKLSNTLRRELEQVFDDAAAA